MLLTRTTVLAVGTGRGRGRGRLPAGARVPLSRTPARNATTSTTPASADFRNMPPTVVATAEYDPLHDEGVELAAKMRAAGVAVRHVPGEGLVHGYFLMQGIVPAAAACA
ncbi:alpha/beta hydrolase fold domain-containing protein [Streptomyces sp. NPDC086182]|uniref:alpha/beta hydrolase n=1 Tax=Streptomyces sp. NPDC086182 TaxID=3155058 RepID=UPI00341B74FF